MREYPYSFHIALDGNGINGLEGLAGVCLFLFDPSDNAFAFKIKYYPGVAAGHAVSVNPALSIGLLGNTGQHLLFYDPRDLSEIERVSTLRVEVPDSALQGSTHAVWLSDSEFVTAIGEHFYRFHTDSLARPERLGPHLIKLPHAIKLTHSRRYLVYGGMDHPRLGEAREVGIFSFETGKARRLQLPATCWHVLPHPTEDVFYAITFRVAPQDNVDYLEWGMSYLKEYVFEIDAAEGVVRRHWAAGRQLPVHINSDITISKDELIFCTGGSQSIIFLNRHDFSTFSLIDERATIFDMMQRPREVFGQVYDTFSRGNVFTNSRHFFGALRVSRFSLLDSIYACQLTFDEKYLFTANRGLNHITIYSYPEKSMLLRIPMPEINEFVPTISRLDDARLGFHHSAVFGGGQVTPS